MLKIGMTVFFRDRSNRIRKGTIDKTSVVGGEKLYRVNGARWFQKDGLSLT